MGPRRSMFEHKLCVEKARGIRKIKDAKNKALMDEHGFENMRRKQQELLSVNTDDAAGCCVGYVVASMVVDLHCDQRHSDESFAHNQITIK